MGRLLDLNSKTVIILYVIGDIICLGMGMGVPIFCILLGLPLGWYITERVSVSSEQLYQKYFKIFKYSLLASVFTFIQLVVVWGKAILMLFDPLSDFENFGHPYILFEPKASFIGWLILMVIISPLLQLLTAIFGSFLALIRIEKKLQQQGV